MIDNPYSSFDIKGKVALVVGATGCLLYTSDAADD